MSIEEIPDEPVQRLSFSTILPKLQLAWDSTSLGALKRCPRYYQYGIIEGYVSRGESPHLRFGSEYNNALVTFHTLRAEGMDYENAVIGCVRYLLEHTWDYALGRPWTSDEPTKTRATLLRSVIWYLDKFAEDPLETVVHASGKPALELSFRISLDIESLTGETYMLCGYLDREVNFADSMWITDFKTTKSALDLKYFAQYSPNNQVSQYAFAGAIISPEPISGIIIDAAQVGVTYTRFQRSQIPRTPPQLEEWHHDALIYIRQNEAYIENDYWPQNDTSCVSGDTIVSVARGARRGWKMSIRDLYKMLYMERGSRFNPSIDTMLLSDLGGPVGYQKMVSVVRTGIKPVFQLVTMDGKNIKATADHRFNTPYGWKRVDELCAGDVVYSWNFGKGLPEEQKKKAKHRATVGGLYFYPRGYRKPSQSAGIRIRKLGAIQRKSILQAEASLNGMQLSEFLWIVKYDEVRAKTLRYLPSEVEVHHADGNEQNDAAWNLEVLTIDEHKDQHNVAQQIHKLGQTILTSIEPVGEEETYDIEMVGPHHNFIANGFVAHNCQQYGGCPFREVCGSSPGIRPRLLKSLYNRRSWDPLLIREI